MKPRASAGINTIHINTGMIQCFNNQLHGWIFRRAGRVEKSTLKWIIYTIMYVALILSVRLSEKKINFFLKF